MQNADAQASTRPATAWLLPARIATVMLVGGLLAGAFALLLDLGSELDAPGVVRIDEAVHLALPRDCRNAGPCERRFRLAFEPRGAPGDGLALLLPQYTGNVTLALNGTPLADSRTLQSSVHIGQGAPLLVQLPADLLRPDGNRIDLALATRIGYGGFVGPVFVGPDALLRPAYDRARFVGSVLRRLVDGMLLGVGLIMLLVWLLRRQEALYLLCAAISLSFSLSSLSSVATETMDGHLLMAINLLRFVGAGLVLPFAYLLVGRRPPVPIAVFLLFPLGIYASAYLAPSGWGPWLGSAVFVPGVVLLLAGSIFVLARASLQGQGTGPLLMLAALASVLVLLVRDALANAGVIPGGYLVMARFNGAILTVMMGTILLRRLVAGLAVLEEFNARLARDVAAAEERLRAAFHRDRAHMRQATLQSERMRLMGDLHDGIAGQLVSIISLSEQGGEGAREEIAGASNRALTDLRLVVDSMEDVGEDFGMTLVAFRERLEPQLRRCGVRLDWKVRELPDLPGLHPSATLAIFRLLQEAVNNAMRHSGSDVVEVSSGRSPLPGHGARLVVRDYGCGGAGTRRGGHGMDNMHRRAAYLGATLAIEAGDPGTRVVIDLPVRLEQPTEEDATT